MMATNRKRRKPRKVSIQENTTLYVPGSLIDSLFVPQMITGGDVSKISSTVGAGLSLIPGVGTAVGAGVAGLGNLVGGIMSARERKEAEKERKRREEEEKAKISAAYHNSVLDVFPESGVESPFFAKGGALSRVAKKIKKGTLNAAAASAGKSKSEFCANPDLSTINKRRCALWRTFNKYRPGKKQLGGLVIPPEGDEPLVSSRPPVDSGLGLITGTTPKTGAPVTPVTTGQRQLVVAAPQWNPITSNTFSREIKRRFGEQIPSNANIEQINEILGNIPDLIDETGFPKYRAITDPKTGRIQYQKNFPRLDIRQYKPGEKRIQTVLGNYGIPSELGLKERVQEVTKALGGKIQMQGGGQPLSSDALLAQGNPLGHNTPGGDIPITDEQGNTQALVEDEEVVRENQFTGDVEVDSARTGHADITKNISAAKGILEGIRENINLQGLDKFKKNTLDRILEPLQQAMFNLDLANEATFTQQESSKVPARGIDYGQQEGRPLVQQEACGGKIYKMQGGGSMVAGLPGMMGSPNNYYTPNLNQIGNMGNTLGDLVGTLFATGGTVMKKKPVKKKVYQVGGALTADNEDFIEPLPATVSSLQGEGPLTMDMFTSPGLTDQSGGASSTIGNVLSTVGNVAGAVSPYLSNIADLFIKDPEVPVPISTPSMKMQTRFNVTPQVQAIQEQQSRLKQSLGNLSPQQRVAASLASQAQASKALSDVYSQKENIETRLQNLAAQNLQGVTAQNVRGLNEYQLSKLGRDIAEKERLRANIANLSEKFQIRERDKALIERDKQIQDLILQRYQDTGVGVNPYQFDWFMESRSLEDLQRDYDNFKASGRNENNELMQKIKSRIEGMGGSTT